MHIPWRAMAPGIASTWLDAHKLGLTMRQHRSLTSARLDLLPPPSLQALQGGYVLDVGANVGDWTAALLNVVPSARVLALEPNPGSFDVLAQRFAEDARVTVSRRAASNTNAELEFYATEHSHNASLHQPRQETGELYHGGGWETTATFSVDAVTIDQLVGDRDVALLKLDVQGAEREALEGAGTTLTRTGAILLEVTFVSHYDGDASFAELHEMMLSRGFVLAGLSQPFMSKMSTALWSDACYVRSPQTPGTQVEKFVGNT